MSKQSEITVVDMLGKIWESKVHTQREESEGNKPNNNTESSSNDEANSR